MKIDVLDHGYVRLVRAMEGGDLVEVNAARVSFEKESNEMGQADRDLCEYLANAKPTPHDSPYRHGICQFEVRAPLMIARQWWKYIVGSDHRDPFTAWNESSRRYVTEDVVFHLPAADEWRKAAKNKKQGSAGHWSEGVGEKWTQHLSDFQETGRAYYERAVEVGFAPEQARLFLPAYGLYVRWYWTGSVASICHLITQRTAPDAQHEFREYAKAVEELTAQHFPEAVKHLVKRYPMKVYGVFGEETGTLHKVFTREKDAERFRDKWNLCVLVEQERVHVAALDLN